MNIQTERLENHTARFTVSLENDRLERAKQEAARKLSKRVNIPGFRKGKAPYKILLQYLGEGAILEDAIEILGNDVYKSALDESGVEPYGPGQLEDFKVDPQPTFTFVVPLQPTLNLGDYRSIRLDYHEPTVDDDQVNKAMRRIQEDEALYEDSSQAVAPGNRVTLELYAKLVGEEGESEAEHSHEESEAHDHDHEHGDEEHDHDHNHGLGGKEFIHEHNAVMILSEENEEPAPGFRDALFGAAIDEERVFELTYPDDAEEYEEYAGKKAQFKAKILKIETVTLPELTDDFAARVTEKQEKPLTLLELRMQTRENLEKSVAQRAKSEFAGEALDKLVEQATISFPEVMVDDQTEDYLQRLDQDFRRQGLTLDDYMRIANKTRDEIKTDYRDIAVRNLKRALVLRELRTVEKVEVTEDSINAEIDKMLGQFGEQAESLRGLLDTPQMRENIKNDLLERAVMDRLVEIAKGEAPELLTSDAGEEATSS
ncbi:MAG: trigger factor [Anaerolineae bacterium]|nr:trigger factor [Anaerolineae bacterium]